MPNPSSHWTAVVLAGQRPGSDPLASHFGQSLKALVPIAGQSMVSRVVETLRACPEVVRIVVLAQSEDVMAPLVPGAAQFIPSGGGIASSIAAIAGRGAVGWPLLVTTADHPLLTPQIIASFLAGAGDSDLAVGMVERSVLESAYPENRRTWLKLADGDWSGANLFALTGPKVAPALALWSRAEQDRKKVFKLFWRFGPWLFLRALTRTIGLAAGLETAGRKLGLTARLVPLPQAEAAIDVDKPSDHALAEAILTARQPA